uniref:hypothetical protein n=1 Tax=Roseivirga sp. TaxID=1964215 RepID=UPI004048D372
MLKSGLIKKAYKPLTELLVVFVSISVAFALNNWNESKKENLEKLKVLRSLQNELQFIQNIFPEMAEYQKKMTKKWDSLMHQGTLPDFYNYWYLQPQYNYSVLEYAIATRNSKIVGFELHEEMLKIYNEFIRLKESETYMTNIALEYQPLPNNKGENLMAERNKFLFQKFLVYGKARARLLQEISELSDEILPIITKQLDNE